MQLGTETGSLMNHVMTTSLQPTPQVGMGVTLCHWTDREAATIIAVHPNGQRFTVQTDTATRADGSGMSDAQAYTYTANPEGIIYNVRKTQKGWKVSGYGYGVILGARRAYYDYSF